jgi:hypothetical protein
MWGLRWQREKATWGTASIETALPWSEISLSSGVPGCYKNHLGTVYLPGFVLWWSSRTTPYRIVPKEMIMTLKFDAEKDRIGSRYSVKVLNLA